MYCYYMRTGAKLLALARRAAVVYDVSWPSRRRCRERDSQGAVTGFVCCVPGRQVYELTSCDGCVALLYTNPGVYGSCSVWSARVKR